MKPKIILLIVLISVLQIVIITSTVFGNPVNEGAGTGGGSNNIKLTNPLSCDDLTCVVQKIINGIFTLSIPVTVLMVLVGAFQLLTAGGQEEKIKEGKNTIRWAVIGFGLVIISLGLVKIIMELVGARK